MIKLIFILLLLFISMPVACAGNYWNTSFSAYSTVTMNNAAPENNYQVLLSSDDFTIPLTMWNEMDHNGNDTRIVNYNHTIEFPVWIDHLTSRDDFLIYVNVTNNDSAIYQWYYDNSSVGGVSDGDATFIQYHGAAFTAYHDTNTFLNNIVYESKIKTTTSSHRIYTGVSEGAGLTDDHIFIQSFSGANLRLFGTRDGGASHTISENPDWPTDTYVQLKITFDGTTATGYVDDNKISTSITSVIPNENMGLWLYIDSGTVVQDWSFVRKYNINEPIITDISEPYYYACVPTIDKYNNSISDSNMYPVLNYGGSVIFYASTDEHVETWTWYIDSVDQSHNFNNLTYAWNSKGYKSVEVYATNIYGTSLPIIWNPYVQMEMAGPGDTISEMDETGYDNLMLGLEGDRPDFEVMLWGITEPYQGVVGNMFFCILFGLPMAMFWIRQSSLIIPSVFGIVLGFAMFNFMPSSFAATASAIIIMSILANFYNFYKERR